MLSYETPKAELHGFAGLPRWAVILIAIFVPGLCSVLLRGKSRLWVMACLCATPFLAFVILGPLWGEVLFIHTKYAESGLYPFLLICFATPLGSVWIALRDWKRARRDG